MSVPVALTETSTVCRTCLKVLDTTGFTYLDDESGYIKNVGNIREMLQFCVPELDLYVSSSPVICYQCLPILVQVYNFKIKSLNVESSIRAYITRNNLQEYNHVNLNCVLMDDLRIKSQKIQIENRIKHLMLQEGLSDLIQATQNQKEMNETSSETNKALEASLEESHLDNNDSNSMDPMAMVETETNEVSEEETTRETIEKHMKIEIEESTETNADFESLNQDSCEADETITVNDVETDDDDDDVVVEEAKVEKQKITVAVRKDLFSNTTQDITTPKEVPPPPIILNNGLMARNGRIVLKIDRSRLQTLTANSNEDRPIAPTAPVQQKTTLSIKPPPLTPIQIAPAPSERSETSASKDSGETEHTYTCNKCSFVTPDVIKMYDHNRTHHSFDYTCQHCPFSTSKVELLGKHMTMVHPQNMVHRNQSFKVSENYACALCPFSVKSVELLRVHHITAHGNSDSDGRLLLNKSMGEDMIKIEPKILKRVEYACDVCPYSTRDKSNLRKHLFTHGTKPLKCEYCSYKCVSPYQLRRHQKQKHAKQLECKVRSQPYKLPTLQPKSENLDEFKITLETIKRELEKEITT